MAPSLRRSYPVSSVLRANPPPHSTAQPDPRGLPVGGHVPPPLGLPVLRSIPSACMLTPLPRWDHRMLSLISSGGFCLPRKSGGSAPTSCLSRPAQRSLTFRPACSPSRPRRPSAPKASTVSLPPPPLRLLPAGATSCRVGMSPTENRRLFTAHRGYGQLQGQSRQDPAVGVPYLSGSPISC